jgi:hypothetical protein
MSDLINETELRRLAEKRVDAKAAFLIHAAIFVVVNAGMTAANLTTTPPSPWFLWCAGFWGLTLAAQGIGVYVDAPRLRRDAIEAELERLRRAARR